MLNRKLMSLQQSDIRSHNMAYLYIYKIELQLAREIPGGFMTNRRVSIMTTTFDRNNKTDFKIFFICPAFPHITVYFPFLVLIFLKQNSNSFPSRIYPSARPHLPGREANLAAIEKKTFNIIVYIQYQVLKQHEIFSMQVF